VLRVDSHGYTAAVLDKIVTSGGNSKSFQSAHHMVEKQAEVSVSAMQIARLTHEIGRELVQCRDQQAELHRFRQLPVDANQPPVQIACIEADGARTMTRASHQGRGVHDKSWKEPKVGVLWRMTGQTFESDPHPELPGCFQDQQYVEQLVRELKSGGGSASPAEVPTAADARAAVPAEMRAAEPAVETAVNDTRGGEIAAAASLGTAAEAAVAAPEAGAAAARSADSAALKPPVQWPPRRVFRTCVATLRDVHGFGPLLAAEAQRRGFYQASQKVFLGDGQTANWTVHRLYFPDFVPVTDFPHVVPYVYEPARAVTADRPSAWRRCQEWLTLCWQGRVVEVMAALQAWQAAHPVPPGVRLTSLPENHPQRVVAGAVTYLEHNQSRMDYPRYRCLGLPVTSALVESLIKQFNWRMKGTEKYWNRSEEPAISPRTGRPIRGRVVVDPPEMSVESMLQVRAALLSDDDRLSKHIRARPGCPFVRRSTQRRRAA